jgi:hypothetical protein
LEREGLISPFSSQEKGFGDEFLSLKGVETDFSFIENLMSLYLFLVF